MTTYFCEQALLANPSQGRLASEVVIETADDRITSVSAGAPCPDDAVRLTGLTLPGLVNAHSHAFHRALRGVGERPGDFWSWRQAMYALAGRLEPDSYQRLCTAVFTEMLLAGITTVGEFHYLHRAPDGARYADENLMARCVLAAASDAGIRITLVDACYLHGGIGGVELEGTQRRFGDGSVEHYFERATDLETGPTARLALAAHSVRALTPDELFRIAELREQSALRMHFHLSEQRRENEECLAAYEMTPTAVLSKAGLFGQHSTAVHATHCDASDVGLLGASRTAVCFCPTTERALADGIGPAFELATAGSPLAVGSDSQAVIDLFEEARAIELDERLQTGRRGLHAPADLLAAATANGAAALGWPEVGRIEEGALCDLTALALDSPRTAGAGDNPVTTAVFSASAADVTDVVVGGAHVVKSGTHWKFAHPGDLLAAAITPLRTNR